MYIVLVWQLVNANRGIVVFLEFFRHISEFECCKTFIELKLKIYLLNVNVFLHLLSCTLDILKRGVKYEMCDVYVIFAIT